MRIVLINIGKVLNSSISFELKTDMDVLKIRKGKEFKSGTAWMKQEAKSNIDATCLQPSEKLKTISNFEVARELVCYWYNKCWKKGIVSNNWIIRFFNFKYPCYRIDFDNFCFMGGIWY